MSYIPGIAFSIRIKLDKTKVITNRGKRVGENMILGSIKSPVFYLVCILYYNVFSKNIRGC